MKVLISLALIVAGAAAGVVERRQLVHGRCDMMCTQQYAPVCGSDGQTYSNMCFLQVAECYYREKGMTLTLTHHGACGGSSSSSSSVDKTSCDTICDEERQPVCASDGNVYGNTCLFKRAHCEAALVGQNLNIVVMGDTCPTPVVPDCSKYEMDTSDIAIEGGSHLMPSCPSDLHYVCGSDSHTYTNECSLCRHNHDNDGNVTIIHSGQCLHHQLNTGHNVGTLDQLLQNLLHGGQGQDPLAG